VDTGELGSKTAIPATDALGGLQIQISGVFYTRTKTRRADEGAVGAGQAAAGDFVPTRMFLIAV
jgi:hypothetical protein